MEDYAGNSKKDKKKTKEIAKDPIEKVVVGEVVQKHKGIGRKFKEVFFGGDSRHAAEFVASDVILPALRNLVVDMVTKGAERLIYGESSRGRSGGGPSYNYSGRYSVGAPGSRAPWVPDPRGPVGPQINRGRQNRHDIRDIILATRQEADLVVERLIDILEKYDVVSVSDLYELLGLETSFVDQKWGWTNLTGVQVRQIRQGYLLELPLLEEI